MRGPAPVHLWNPAYCGEIDMRIAADGSWHYNGSPINRIAMVKLFASILRKDKDRYVLVTPVERVGICVDDAPFIAIQLDTEHSDTSKRLFIRTNLDDVVEVGAQHPMRFTVLPDGGVKPYIHIRGDLWALASRSLTHELLELGIIVQSPVYDANSIATTIEDTPQTNVAAVFGIRSGDSFFPVGPVRELGLDG